MPMRRLSLILLAILALAPSAYAASRAVGDGVLELRHVDGTVLIGTLKNPAEGALWGQMDRGVLKVTDPDPTDGRVHVSGADRKPIVTETPLGTITTYRGDNLTFRVTGGTYRLLFNGSGIDLTAVGVGVAWLNGNPDDPDDGDYAVDGGKWTPVPAFLETKVVDAVAVPFGDQTVTGSTSP